MKHQASRTFARNLRIEIESRGISQRELAKLSGVTTTYINRILVSKQNPTIEICDRIAVSLGLSLTKLLTVKKRAKKPVDTSVG